MLRSLLSAFAAIACLTALLAPRDALAERSPQVSPQALPLPCSLSLYIPNCAIADQEAFPQTQRPQIGGDCQGDPLVLEDLDLLDSDGEPTGILFESDGIQCDGYPAYTLETTLFPDEYTAVYRLGEDAVALSFYVEQPRVDTELPGGCGCDGGAGAGDGAGWSYGLIIMGTLLGRRLRRP